MSDKEARATGAGDSIEVDGKTWHLVPLRMTQLHEIQRKALASYRSSYLQTFADNAKLLGDAGEGLLASKLEEVAKWDVSDLPVKYANNCENVPINNKLVATIRQELELSDEECAEFIKDEKKAKQRLAGLLDQGLLTLDQVKKATGVVPRRIRAHYDMWWATATHEGRIATIVASLLRHHPNVTKTDIQDWSLHAMIDAVSMIESLTAPTVGNT